jgi:hypothetical protein
MYFALAYFAQVEPRPAVGAPVVGAKDWWRDNPMLAQIFREYFDHRSAMGDEATFGPALYLPSASPFASIRGFLERMSHPLAAALISALNDIQRSQIDKGFLTTFGRFWTDHDAEILIDSQEWNAQLSAAESTLQRSVPRRCWSAANSSSAKAPCFGFSRDDSRSRAGPYLKPAERI